MVVAGRRQASRGPVGRIVRPAIPTRESHVGSLAAKAVSLRNCRIAQPSLDRPMWTSPSWSGCASSG